MSSIPPRRADRASGVRRRVLLGRRTRPHGVTVVVRIRAVGGRSVVEAEGDVKTGVLILRRALEVI